MPVQDILGKIERGEIALPDIQREFVWTNTQVKDLIESIYRKNPIGLILLWEKPFGKDIPTVLIEEVRTDERPYKELIIDGQQRLTSILLVHRGKLTRNGKAREIELLFNPLEEEFQLGNPKIRNKPNWFNVTKVIHEPLTKLIDKERLKNELNLTDNDIDTKIYNRLEELKSQLNREPIPVFRIPSNKDYEEIAKIFVNINSKGTRIRITELLLALLAIKLPGKFKKNLNDFLSELEDKGWELDVSILIRSLVAIATGQGRLQYFRNISEGMSETDLEVHWKATKENLEHLIKILYENLAITDSSLLPSEAVLVPLVLYLKQKNGRLSSDETKDLISWFLLASFWGRYAGATDTQLDEDIKDIKKENNLQGLFKNLKNKVGRLKISTDDFVGSGNDKKLLLYVICKEEGATDWFKGHKITTSDIQYHHIYPRSLLKKRGIDGNLINDISNIAFLTEKANKTILNKEPSEYLKDIDEEKLKKQFVPLDKELWKLENYEKFLEKRRQIIVDKINEYFQSLGAGTYP